MITTIVGALALSSIVPPPDYYEFQIIETPSYTVEYSVKWWESSDKYLYTLLNTDDSMISITDWAVIGAAIFAVVAVLIAGRFT